MISLLKLINEVQKVRPIRIKESFRGSNLVMQLVDVPNEYGYFNTQGNLVVSRINSVANLIKSSGLENLVGKLANHLIIPREYVVIEEIDLQEVKRIHHLIKAKVVNPELERIEIYFDGKTIYGLAFIDIRQVQVEYASYRGYDQNYADFISYLMDHKVPFERETMSQMEEVLIIYIMYFDIEGIELLH